MAIELSLFGPFQTVVDGADVTAFRSDKARALLAYVAAQPESAHARDALATLFWGEQNDASAKTNLRNVLSNLRKITRSAESGEAIDVTRKTVQLAPPVVVDSARFSDLLAAVQRHSHAELTECAHCVGLAKQAINLYRGDFLAHLYVADAPAFDDWSTTVREHLRQRAIDALRLVTGFHTARGEYAVALPYARRLTKMEPWDEAGHAHLLRLLAWQGQRAAALRHFDAVAAVLDEELGVSPSAELATLRDQIEAAPAQRPHNLPAKTTPFVGRAEEMARLATHLAHPDRRLITLVGPGGIGKTRLALEAAQRAAYTHLGPFLDGVFLVQLAGLDSAEQVPIAIADALGIRLAGRATPGREVEMHLRRRQLLIVLDNVEHLLDDGRVAGWIERLLRQAPGVKLLATSRVTLNIGSEWTVMLDGLTYPANDDASGDTSIETLVQYDAVSFFVQRVQQVDSTFGMTSRTAPCTVRICRLVNGIPLAIELAAGWIKLFSCEEIAQEIERNVDVLASNRGDLPSRHRSMRAVFDYSWVLLNADEQRVLMTLSVFRGSFDRAAAQSVAGVSLLDLDGLLNKSWLHKAAESAENGSVRRFHMLESLRQYAVERLAQAPDGLAVSVRDKHARHYLTSAAEHGPQLRGADQMRVLATMRPDADNVRAAWLWAVKRGQFELLDASLNAVFDYHDIRSTFRDGSELLLAAVEGVRQTRAAALAARLEARFGWLQYHLGTSEDAVAHLSNALAAARRLALSEEITFALNYLGAIARHDNRLDDAERDLQEALAVARSCGDVFGASIALNNLSQIAWRRGELETARQFAVDGLALNQKLGDRRGSAFSHLYLAQIDAALGNLDAAHDQFDNAIAIYTGLGDQRGMALTHASAGDALRDAGKVEEAAQAYALAARLFETIGLTDESARLRARASAE